MNVNQGFWQQQTIKLTMTQELSQAIALLQYSSQEIAAFLEEKALENPLLQIESLKEQIMDPRYDKAKKTRKRSQVDKQNWLEQIAKKKPPLSTICMHKLTFAFMIKE